MCATTIDWTARLGLFMIVARSAAVSISIGQRGQFFYFSQRIA
jgi:hypothetical protein